jgi:rubrerythrin
MQSYTRTQRRNKTYTEKNDNKAEPFMMGNGELDYVCGQCNYVMAENVSQGEISTDTAFQCPNCKEFNEVYNV